MPLVGRSHSALLGDVAGALAACPLLLAGASLERRDPASHLRHHEARGGMVAVRGVAKDSARGGAEDQGRPAGIDQMDATWLTR
jgi:hypothetical protein